MAGSNGQTAPRWSAHLHMLFTELPFLERFQAAKERGFECVECWSPFADAISSVATAVERAGVQLAGFNLPAGDMAAGDRGYLNVPGVRDGVMECAREALELADRLSCSSINALVGNQVGSDHAAERAESVTSLRQVAQLAEGHEVSILVEPLNSLDNPRYLVNTPDDAAGVIAEVDHPRVGMLFDVFQVARMGLDPATELRRHAATVRHIQIADAPGRHAPGSGSVDFATFFGVASKLGYSGYVGLEYRPTDDQDTDSALAWLPQEHRVRVDPRLVANAR